MSGVRSWPSYLLQRIPPQLRTAIEEDAGQNSMAEVIRAILCAHYSLDCEPPEYELQPGSIPERIPGHDRMLVRVQPELFEAIKQHSDESGETMRTVILDILEAHYSPVT